MWLLIYEISFNMDYMKGGLMLKNLMIIRLIGTRIYSTLIRLIVLG